MFTALMALGYCALIAINIVRIRRGHRGSISLFLLAATIAATTTIIHTRNESWVDVPFTAGALIFAVYAAGAAHGRRIEASSDRGGWTQDR